MTAGRVEKGCEDEQQGWETNDGNELQLALRSGWLVWGILLCGGRATVGEKGSMMFQGSFRVESSPGGLLYSQFLKAGVEVGGDSRLEKDCLSWVGPASGHWLTLCYNHSPPPRPPKVHPAQVPARASTGASKLCMGFSSLVPSSCPHLPPQPLQLIGRAPTEPWSVPLLHLSLCLLGMLGHYPAAGEMAQATH